MIFVDTSAWIYLFDKRRGGKEAFAAEKFYKQNNETLVITDLIIEETHRWLIHHSFSEKKALEILHEFTNEHLATIVPIENIDRLNAYQSTYKYSDQQLSFTDAISVAIMRRLKIKEIFSFDSHFDLFRDISRLP